jgi:uncharacterized protein (TIGR02300 family)
MARNHVDKGEGTRLTEALPKWPFERQGLIAVAKPELGAKRQCQACGAKFFDLNKDPIVCPKCGTVFQGVAHARAAAKEDEEDVDLATPAGADVVSLDEVEAGEEKVVETAVEDIDVEDAGDAEDDSFLEEEEEEDDDVSNLIDGDIAPDEEA